MTDKTQAITQAKGRPMLHWAGKKPLDRIEYFPAQEKEVYGKASDGDWNKLFWGDNLQVLAHLLKDYRGKVDLIYIDPPFDSKADYVRKVKIRNQEVTGQPQSLLEEKQYTDIWEKDEYLQFIYERLLIMRELLAETGSIYLHCDWHKVAYLRLIMDEVFGDENFINEIIWWYKDPSGIVKKGFKKKHDNILAYSKTNDYYFNADAVRDEYSEGTKRQAETGTISYGRKTELNPLGKYPVDVWEVSIINSQAQERTDYPTQKPEKLIERIIKGSSKEGDVVADFFVGSGTTSVVAQRLNRRWLACDINLGAVQTTAKRLSDYITNPKLDGRGFKVHNVNDYDVFKNELEAKVIIMNTYGVEPIKLSYFDGVLDNYFVKVMPMNRVLNKLDVTNVLKSVEEKIDAFTVKPSSKAGEAVYEQGVIIICSGKELDVDDYLKHENKTGVKVEIRDLQTDKQSLTFKKPPEAKVAVSVKGNELSVEVKDFYSPMLMQKLELENAKVLSVDQQATVDDYRQIVDSVAIDVDYNGTLFNAEIMDIPTKQDVVKGSYSWQYGQQPATTHYRDAKDITPAEKTKADEATADFIKRAKQGNRHVAVKIVDVLGEEYFETFRV